MSLDLTDKSTLVQVMAWCRQAASHYLSQCWPRSQSPYGVTRPQWVNLSLYILWYCISKTRFSVTPKWDISIKKCPAKYDQHQPGSERDEFITTFVWVYHIRLNVDCFKTYGDPLSSPYLFSMEIHSPVPLEDFFHHPLPDNINRYPGYSFLSAPYQLSAVIYRPWSLDDVKIQQLSHTKLAFCEGNN